MPSTAPKGPKGTVSSPGIGQSLILLAGLVLTAVVGGALMAGLWLPAAIATATATNVTRDLLTELPTELEAPQLSQISNIYAGDGTTLMATFSWQNRVVVESSAISQQMKNAMVAAEDRRFYEHGAIDPQGMARAFVQNASGGATQGASTLTQQYVKNVLVNDAAAKGDQAGVQAAIAEDYGRKIREAKYAIEIEKTTSKDQILTNYLNISAFGPSQYGVEAASLHYFSHSANSLTYLESALLAAVTNNPTLFDPVSNPNNATQRRNAILATMLDMKYITQAEYDQGIATPVEAQLRVNTLKLGCRETTITGAAYFCQYVVNQLLNDPEFAPTAAARQDKLQRGGLTIKTTLDPNLQTMAQETVEKFIPIADPSGIASSLVTVQPGTGQIVNMAQTRRFDDLPQTGLNEQQQAEYNLTFSGVNFNANYIMGGSNGFQPGSSFKPFVLAEWLTEGYGLSDTVNGYKHARGVFPASCIPAGGLVPGGTWPNNSADGEGQRFMTVLEATEDSINTSYASMENALDLCAVRDMANSLGVTPANPNNDTIEKTVFPTMVLGVWEVAPLQMANAYATFAARGMYCPPTAIAEINDADGQPVQYTRTQDQCRRVLSEDVADGLNYALNRALRFGTGAPFSRNSLPFNGAGKTGTTDGSVAAWYVGYTSSLSTAVWTGNPYRNQEMRYMRIGGLYVGITYGATIAGPLWKDFMLKAMDGRESPAWPVPTDAIMNGSKPAPAVVTSGGGGPRTNNSNNSNNSNR
ncbi:penicillin-binding protein [Micrococcales bacterium 31B]|nr:penicillin-binding protein [Micrococcales bacterium 31B]